MGFNFLTRRKSGKHTKPQEVPTHQTPRRIEAVGSQPTKGIYKRRRKVKLDMKLTEGAKPPPIAARVAGRIAGTLLMPTNNAPALLTNGIRKSGDEKHDGVINFSLPGFPGKNGAKTWIGIHVIEAKNKRRPRALISFPTNKSTSDGRFEKKLSKGRTRMVLWVDFPGCGSSTAISGGAAALELWMADANQRVMDWLKRNYNPHSIALVSRSFGNSRAITLVTEPLVKASVHIAPVASYQNAVQGRTIDVMRGTKNMVRNIFVPRPVRPGLRRVKKRVAPIAEKGAARLGSLAAQGAFPAGYELRDGSGTVSKGLSPNDQLENIKQREIKLKKSFLVMPASEDNFDKDSKSAEEMIKRLEERGATVTRESIHRTHGGAVRVPRDTFEKMDEFLWSQGI